MGDKPKKLDSFVSVVTLLQTDADATERYLTALHAHLESHFDDFEILLIDDCTADKYTRVRVETLLLKFSAVRYLRLAFRVHDDVALAAGLENSIGDFVVLHSAIEDSVEVIYELVQLSFEGPDIVIGASVPNQTVGYRLVRPLIHWVLRRIGYNLPRNATGLRCLSRRAVNAITQTGRFHHQFYVRINNTGYPFAIYDYAQNPCNDRTRTLRQGLRQGMHQLVFNSTSPLRWMSALGLGGSLMAFVFSAYSLLVHYFKDTVIEGWTTLVLFMSMLFMVLFVILAFLGEYLGRLLDESNNQGDYMISFEKTSSVMLNVSRENVINE